MALPVVSITGLRVVVSRDTDIVKFKHLYGTLSAVVYELINDTVMYPDASGLAYTTSKTYFDTQKTYGGKEKFKKLFKSKFNIYQDNIQIKPGGDIPLYTDKISKQCAYSTTITCFTDNKGFTYCPPDTPEYIRGVRELETIYLPVFVSKVDTKNLTKYANIKKVVFVEIGRNGKIDVPPVVKNLVDCHKQAYNEYNHCKVIDKMEDMDL